MKTKFYLRLIVFLGIIIPSVGSSATYYSRGTGNWGTAATWSQVACNGTASGTAPGAGDDVVICAGHIVTVDNFFYQALSLTVSGTLDFANASYILQILGGGLTLNNGSVIGNGTATGFLLCTSNLTIPGGATATIKNLNLTISGTSSISGTATFNNTSGNKSFVGDLTVNTGGSLNFTATEIIDLSANLVLAGTANVNGTATGTINIGGGLSVSASANCTVGRVSLIASSTSTIDGTVTFNSTLGNKIFEDAVINSGGSWTSSQGEIYSFNTDLTLNGTAIITGSATGIFDVTNAYNISSGATANVGRCNMTVNGATTIDGTVTYSSATGFKSFASLSVNNGGVISSTAAVTFDIGTDLTLSGNGSLTGSSTAIYNVTGDLIISSGANSTIGNCDLNVSGNGTISGTNTFTSATGTKSLTDLTINTGASMAFSAAETVDVTGNMVMNGTADLSGSATGIVNVTGTLTFGSTPNVTIGACDLTIGGATTISGTVNFNSATGTKTFSDLTISGTMTAPATVISVQGTFDNDGTFNNNTGTVMFNGSSAQTISGTSTTAFANLSIDNMSGLSLSATSITISDVLTVDNGTFAAAGNSITLLSDASKTARIAPISGTGAFSGNFTIQRHIPANGGTLTWANMSSPVASTTFQDWDDELFFTYPHDGYSLWSNVLKYSESAADYVGVSAATTLTTGEGVEVYFANEADVTIFTGAELTTVGTPNYGDQMISLNYNAGPYAGQNLIGNPFASAIECNAITRVNADPNIDVYDNLTDNYTTLTIGSGSDVLASHQGFWAYATGSGASVTVSEAAKSTSLTEEIRKTEVKPFMNLTIQSADNSHKMAHTLFIAANESASDNFNFDEDHPFRKSPNKNAPYITTNSDKYQLVINTFSSNHENYTMALNTKVGIAGKYKLNILGMEFIDKDYGCVVLEDKVLGKKIDLNKTQEYVFLSNEVDNFNRFDLHFSKTGSCKLSADISSSLVSLENSVQVLQKFEGVNVNFNFDATENVQLSVVNVLGQNIIDLQEIEANKQSITIPISNDFHGFYLVKVVSDKGELVKKFYKP